MNKIVHGIWEGKLIFEESFPEIQNVKEIEFILKFKEQDDEIEGIWENKSDKNTCIISGFIEEKFISI